MFKRFLHSPKGLTRVPIPKEANKISEIGKYVEIPQSAELPHTTGLEKVLPSQVSVDALKTQIPSESKVWYFVERTKSGNLPVYTDYNNAGGVWTEVRKIQGNAGALRNDLKAALDLSKREIWVQDTSNRVIIKGNHSQTVKEILGQAF